ncbi:MAG TPA: peptidylprolyl isomerase [Anaerolineae bacterium]|nr:peptidylprolyl isomerase [Anaerolineae bacterium]
MSAKRSSVVCLLLTAVVLLATGCGSPAVTTEAAVTATPGTTPSAASPLPTLGAPGDVPSDPVTSATPSAVDTAMQYVERVDTPLAVVNGQEITWEFYEPSLRQALRMVSRQGNVDWNDAAMQQRLGQLQNDVLTQTVDRWLLREIAADQGIVIKPEEVQAKIDAEKTEILASDVYKSWEAYLETNGFTDKSFEQVVHDTLMLVVLMDAQQVDAQAEQVHIAHISLGDGATAQEVVEKLRSGEDFSQLAAQYSTDDQTKDSGGDLGWFSQELLLPEFAGVAMALEPGQFSDVIPTRYGFTVLTVLEREMREADPAVLAQRKQAALMAVLEAERPKAEIEILVDFDQVEE